MKAWKIYWHSVEMVMRNFLEALKIALVPWAIGVATVVALFVGFGFEMDSFFDEEQLDLLVDQNPGRYLSGMLAMLLAILFVNLWIIVNWHRFVLLEETPQGWMPRVPGRRMLAYVGRILLLSLLGGAGYAIVIAVFLSTYDIFAAAGVGIVIALFSFFALNRVSPILPAAAIGESLGLRGAWRATSGSNLTNLVLILLVGVFNIGTGSIVAGMLNIPFLGIGLTILGLFAIWLTNISVLTTFYGHYVQGRPV